MIDTSTQMMAVVLLPALLLASMVIWVLITQRKESMTHGAQLETSLMAEKLGVREKFEKLNNAAQIDAYINSFTQCNRCNCVEKCQKFIASENQADIRVAQKFCPSVALFAKLDQASA